MRKLSICITAIIFCLVACCSSAFCEVRDTLLKDAFDSGKLTLVPFEYWDGSTDGYKMVLPTSALDTFIEDTGLSVEFKDNGDNITSVWDIPADLVPELMNMYPVSISPDGGIMFSVDQYVRENKFFVLRDKTFTAVMPVYSRGVTDEYGKLSQYNGASTFGPEGIEWSPDGRYAVKKNSKDVLANAQFGTYPLVIMDTYTGEMYLADGLGTRKAKDGGIAAVISAEFSPDSKYLYYTTSGRGFENASTLMRYEMATGETVQLVGYDRDVYAYMPYMNTLKNGGLISTNSNIDDNGLIIYTTNGDEMEYLELSLIDTHTSTYIWTNQYSSNSEYSLSTIRFNENYFAGLMRTSSQNNFADFNTFWIIDNLDSTAAVTVDIPVSDAANYVNYLDVTLSPDGYFALIVGQEYEEIGILMLELDTMNVINVSAPSNLISANLSGSFITIDSRFAPGVTWFPDGRIIMPDENGVPGIYILSNE